MLRLPGTVLHVSRKKSTLMSLYFEDKLCVSIFIVTCFPNSIFMPFLPSTDFTSIFHMCNDVTGHHLPFSGIWIHPGFWWVSDAHICFRFVSFVHNVACISGLYNLDCPFGFSNIYFLEITKKPSAAISCIY